MSEIVISTAAPNQDKPRWLSDDYPDSVQRLKRAYDVLKKPHFVLKVFMFPVFCLIFILSFPVIALFLMFHLVLSPASQRHKVQQQASKTAFGVAVVRSTLYRAGLCSDYLTYLFVPLPVRMIFSVLSLYTTFTGKMFEISVFTVGMMLTRTEIGDELIRRFVIKHNGKQVVILGAGYDTRGYRLDCITSKKYDVKFYEVDVHSTQQNKLEILKKRSIDVSHVTYVPVDFSVETFTECLLKKGWKQDEPTLFLWEGVSMYLVEDAVHSTLRDISKCAKGTYLFFDALEDLFSEEGKKGIYKYPEAQNLLKYVNSRGEPLKWGLKDLSKPAVSSFLSSFGFEMVEHLSAKESAEIFFTRKDGVQACHTTPYALQMIARVA